MPFEKTIDGIVSSGQRPIWLARIRYVYESAGAPAYDFLYAATAMPPNAHVPISAMIANMPEFGIEIAEQTLTGQMTVTVGALVLDDENSASRAFGEVLLHDQPVVLSVGLPEWNTADFVPVFTAYAQPSEVNGGKRTINLYTVDAFTNTSVGGKVVNGVEIPTVIGYCANVFLPQTDANTLEHAFDCRKFVGIYLYGDTPAIRAVRDRGASLGSSPAFPNLLLEYATWPNLGSVFGTQTAIFPDGATDEIVLPGHTCEVNDVLQIFEDSGATPAFGGLTMKQQYWVVAKSANRVKVSLTRGGAVIDLSAAVGAGYFSVIWRRFFIDSVNQKIYLSNQNQGEVTADFAVPPKLAVNPDGSINTGFTSTAKPFEALLDLALDVLPVDRIDYAAFAALDTQFTAATLYGVGWAYTGPSEPLASLTITQRENLQSIFDRVLIPLGCWWGHGIDGRLTVGFTNEQVAPAIAEARVITADELRERNPDGITITPFPTTYSSALWRSRPISHPQTDLVGAVTADDRKRWQSEYAYSVEASNTLDTGPFATAYAAYIKRGARLDLNAAIWWGFSAPNYIAKIPSQLLGKYKPGTFTAAMADSLAALTGKIGDAWIVYGDQAEIANGVKALRRGVRCNPDAGTCVSLLAFRSSYTAQVARYG